GYNCFWMAEHHFQREGTECIPNTILMALHLAHRTKNIKIGCGFNITPMWHPLRLAEDFATADILTGGRIVFGVGRGYHPREVETFGAPLRDPEANPALVAEQVDIIFKAFNNERFSYKGVLHAAARGALSRLHPQRTHPRPATFQAAGRVLATYPGRLDARARVHGQARYPGHGKRWLGRGWG